MKKNQLAAMLLTGAILAITVFNCSKNQQSSGKSGNVDNGVLPDRPNLNFTPDPQNGNRAISPEQPLTVNGSNDRVANITSLRTAGCGGSFSGTWGTTGYHQYAKDTIKVDTSTRTLHINLNAYDVPNRFTVYDSLNNIVAASPWMGFANYSGPWGISLNTSPTGTLNFSRGSYTRFYLLVETSVKSTTDAYTTSITCN
jgi:hypothetical protein